MSAFFKTAIYLLATLPAVAQSQRFATIRITPSRSGDPRDSRMHVLQNGDFISTSVPVIMLLSYAYDVPANPSPRLSSLPEWTVSERYDIEAKAHADTITP
jgi:uncharacterized protein (TIGR03435 family)